MIKFIMLVMAAIAVAQQYPGAAPPCTAARTASCTPKTDASGNLSVPQITLSNGSDDGYVKVCPVADSTHCVTLKSPASRSTDLVVRLPSSDPSGTQYLACGSPSSGVSTCSWSSSGGGMTYPGAGLPISTGSAWGASLTPGSAGHVVRSTGTAYADAQLAFSDLSGNATSAQVLGGFTGTKDSSHCTAGDGTMVSCAGGGSGNATMTIDLPAGGVSSGAISGPWNLGGSGGGGNAYYRGLDFSNSGTPSYKAVFRLPANFDKTKTVSIVVTGGNYNSGLGGSVGLNVKMACFGAGQATYSDPTYGTAASVSITQTADSKMVEGTASSLPLVAACDSKVMASVLVSRDNTVGGNLADIFTVYDVALTYGTK